MKRPAAHYFEKMRGLNFEEQLDGFILSIIPGDFCEFDKQLPANGIHYHNCYELCIVTHGRGAYLHGNEVMELNTGDVFIADPQVFHEISLSCGNSGYGSSYLALVHWLVKIVPPSSGSSSTMESRILDRFLQSHRIHTPEQLHLLDFLKFMDSSSLCLEEYRPDGRHLFRNLVLHALSSLADKALSTGKQAPAADMILENAIRHIKSNLLERPSILEIARYAGTSPRNLQHLFRKHVGKTVVEFCNERKMSLAAGYLRMNFNVGDVGPMVGIYDIAQFSRLFKKYHGVSPKKYQREYSMSGLMESVVSR